MGKELKLNKDRRYFEQLGFATFEAYIENPELGLGWRSVYSLIAIYETFVERLDYSVDELSVVDYSKLDRVLPLINVQPVAHREWFERAKDPAEKRAGTGSQARLATATTKAPVPYSAIHGVAGLA